LSNVIPRENIIQLKKTDRQSLKGIAHPKMKIIPLFTHPQDILGVYDYLLSDEHNPRYLKISRFITVVNGRPNSEDRKNSSIHKKIHPYDSLYSTLIYLT